MKLDRSALRNFRSIFEHSITVKDVAEPLVSFSHRHRALNVSAFMEKKLFDVVGVVKQGLVVGYVERPDLQGGQVSKYLRSFEQSDLLGESAPVSRLVRKLDEKDWIFATAFGRVGGIVTRADMQKAPVRMWMFGLVSMLEMELQQAIESVYPGNSWMTCLTEGRQEKARRMYEDRVRKNVSIELIDCLEYADKKEIFARSLKLLSLTEISSKSQFQKKVGGIINLRNDLAHVQDLSYRSWPETSQILKDCESLLSTLGRLG